MRQMLVFFLLIISSSCPAQILDTLRVDTCFNIAFGKNQVDYYYLEQEDKNVYLRRSTKILELSFPSREYLGAFFTTENSIRMDKTGTFKDGNKDTIEVKKPNGALNHLIIREYFSVDFAEEIYMKEKYVCPNEEKEFLDYHPNGRPFRKVILDNMGRIAAAWSNNQIDSFLISFTQLDEDSNVVVYQRQSFVTDKQFGYQKSDYSNANVLCFYSNGVLAYSESKKTDSTWLKKVYWRNGSIKQVVEVQYKEIKDKTLSTSEEPVWKVVEVVSVKKFDRNGKVVR